MKIDGEKLAQLITQAVEGFDPAHALDSREIELGRVNGLDVVVVIGRIHEAEQPSALTYSRDEQHRRELEAGYNFALAQIRDCGALCRTVTPEPTTAYDNGMWHARMDVINSDGTGTAPADLVAAALRKEEKW